MFLKGWRIEYTAACDSFTACPQEFAEFYNQRKRWLPSTMMNLYDIIKDWSEIVARNDQISSGYMFYQLFNLIGFIIGPGTIFLLLISASSLAFGLNNTESMILNLVLIGMFFLGCIQLEKKQQISLAQVNRKR